MKNTSQEEAVPGLLRRLNVRRVLDTLHELGPSTRAQLTRRTRISPPTMSKLMSQLVRAGLVEQDATPVVTRGRPGVLFRLAARNVQVVAVVLDVHRCTVTSAGLDGNLANGRSFSFPTPDRFERLTEALVKHVRELIAENGVPCIGLGLTVPGLIDRQRGEVVFSPNMHFLDGKNPGRVLSERLGMEVVTLQEEHALCLGERMFGKAKGLSDFAVLDITEGLGMGAFTGGRFLTGARGFGGEIGHITVEPKGRLCGCGNRGCLETIATDTALALAFSEQFGRPLDIDTVIRMARVGELKPGEILERAIDFLAIGVAAVINILNPEAVLIYGRMFDLQDGLLARLEEKVKQRALKPSVEGCRIVRTEANKHLGAIAAVIEHVYNRMGPRMNAP